LSRTAITSMRGKWRAPFPTLPIPMWFSPVKQLIIFRLLLLQ